MDSKENDEKDIDQTLLPVIRLWQEGVNGDFDIMWRSHIPKITVYAQLIFWFVVALAVWVFFFALNGQSIFTTIDSGSI